MINLIIFIGLLKIANGVELPDFDREPAKANLVGYLMDRYMHFNMTVGPPGKSKTIEFIIDDTADMRHLVVSNVILDYVYGKQGNDKHHGRHCSIERFGFDGVDLKKKVFMRMDEGPSFYQEEISMGRMGIRRYKGHETEMNCKSFVESVLKDKKEKVLTFAYDRITTPQYGAWFVQDGFTGNMFFGSKAPKLCSNDWAYIDKTGDNWDFNVTKVTFGNQTFSRPFRVLITHDYGHMKLPTDLIEMVYKELGAETNENIPCFSEKDLTFHFGDKEFHIPSSRYTMENPSTKQCVSNMDDAHPTISFLPLTVFSGHCLMYDYEKKRIGISKRV